MAQATTSIVRANVASEAQAQRQIAEALDANAEGVVEALALLQGLEDRGILLLLRALMEQGDDVLKVIIRLVQHKEYTGAIQNLFGILQLLTKLNPQAMQTLVTSVSAGVDRATSVAPDTQLGIYDALKAFRDPDVSRAISFLLSFLKGMGGALASPKTEEAI